MRQVSGLPRLVRLGGALGYLAVGALGGGCSLHQSGVNPPDNRIFFPGGAMVDPAGHWLYVINSNSDLRYNAGTVSVVDLPAARQDDPRDPGFTDPGAVTKCTTAAPPDGVCWQSCPLDPRFVPAPNDPHLCCWDTLDEHILNCDEQAYVRRESTVRIGSFGGRPVMQAITSDAPNAPAERMFVPVRGDTSITFMNVAATPDGVAFSCTGTRSNPKPPAPFASCDDHFRITRADDPLDTTSPVPPDDQVANLPLEPYAIEVDSDAQLLYIGHLRGGTISLIDLGNATEDTRPALAQLYNNLLPADVSGQQGVTSLTVRDPGFCGAVYVASRFRPVIGSFVVYGVEGCPTTQKVPQSDRTVAIVSRGEILSTGLGAGSETRGIEFPRRKSGAPCAANPADPDCAPDRAFILQRTPPALVAIDTTTLAPFATIETCQGPTHLVQQIDQSQGGATVALFVTCFDGGEVDVIDPWAPRLRTAIPVGRGPITTVLDPTDAAHAYVVGFGGNDVVVLALDPSEPGQDRVVQRIGFPSPTPRDPDSHQP